MTAIGRKLATGRTADVFAYGRDSVVKVLNPVAPPNWAEIEFDLARRIHELDLPTPEPRGVVEVDGRPAVVFERVHGTSMQSAVIAGELAVTDSADLLAEIHREVLACEPPPGMPAAGDRLTAKIMSLNIVSEAERRQGERLVRSLSGDQRLLHGDLHPNNVILTASGPVVIDWYDASVGLSAIDVARSKLLMSSPATEMERELASTATIGSPPNLPLHLPGATVELLDTFRTRYLQRMEPVLDEFGVDDETWHTCLAVTALGRIAEQVDPDAGPLLAIWRKRRPVSRA